MQTTNQETEVDLELALEETILPAMIKSPSAHNTQPWSFVRSNGGLDVYPDWNRHLDVSDRTTRQTYVSLGCAIANAIAAANYCELACKVSYFPDGISENKPAARLIFTHNPNAIPDHLFSALNRRRTDRSLYDQQPLSQSERQKLSASENPDLFLIESEQEMKEMAKVTESATFSTLSRPEFREELSRWIRNNWTHQPDGMPGYAVGMPTPISFVMPFGIKYAPIHRQEAPKAKKQILSSSTVAIIATPTDTPTDWVKAGQLLETVWLHAIDAGLAAMPIISAVESSPETRKELQRICQTNNYPQTVLRIGHSSKKELRASPRRRVGDCKKLPIQRAN